MKKTLSIFTSLVITIGTINIAHAENVSSSEQINKELERIGYSSDEIKILEERRNDDQEFYEKFLDEKIENDQEKSQQILKEREVDRGKNSGMRMASSSRNAWGETGDILVSYEIDSGSAAIGVGHSAIVSTNSEKTIESFAKDYSPVNKNGVVYLPNEWKKTSKSFLGIVDTTNSDRKAAAKYAYDQIGKPYNWKFFQKKRTDSFYCSQLVWRSWYEQDIEIDGNPDDDLVTPIELLKSDNVFVVKNKNN